MSPLGVLEFSAFPPVLLSSTVPPTPLIGIRVNPCATPLWGGPSGQDGRSDSKHKVTLPVSVPYQRTAVSSQLPCPSLRCWLHRLKSAVSSVLQEDRLRGKSSTAHVNTFPMIRWVLRRIRDGGWTLLPDDKEPGFCFVTARPRILQFLRWFQGLMSSRTSLICGSLG